MICLTHGQWVAALHCANSLRFHLACRPDNFVTQDVNLYRMTALI